MSDIPRRIIGLPVIESLEDLPETARMMVDSPVDSEDTNTGVRGMLVSELLDKIDDDVNDAINYYGGKVTQSLTQNDAIHKVLLSYSNTNNTEMKMVLKHSGLRYNPANSGLMQGKYDVVASGDYSHAEGSGTTASATGSHAEGENSVASGNYSHAEGISEASGYYSHSEGGSVASGEYSHAEGYATESSGESSHSEGDGTESSGRYSHAEGFHTIANHKSQHVFGEYNYEDDSSASSNSRGKYIEIAGNGADSDHRSNARTLDWNGNEVLAGKLTVGAQPTNDMDVATKKYVDESGGGGGGTTVVANPSGTATANLNKLQVGSTIYSVGGLEIIDTLEAGETELTIQNNAITTTATYDFFTDAFGVSPTDVEVTTGQIVLTFEEQESDVSVKVRIS